MAVGRVGNYPDYTFDGVNKNIPIIFSGKTLEKFYASTVLTEISNTDYLGEIKNQGDKVIIRTTPNITISDYNKGQKLDLEHPESPAMELTIDYAKYFNFALDDIDIKQFDIAMMDKWADDAAQQLKISIESKVFADSTIYNGAVAANKGNTAGRISGNLTFGAAGTPLILTRDNILDIIIDVNLCLNEQNIPEESRYILLPSWAIAMLKKSDLKDASLTGDASSTLRTGRVGTIDGLTLYSSNLLATASDGSGVTAWRCIAGHKMGFCFVTQLTKVETYRPQDTFADAMKGLNVFGYGIVQAASMVNLYIAKG
jgi:hypothetical protein